MQRRIFGLETEFGLTFLSHSGRRISPEESARYLFAPIMAWGKSSNVFLQNAARLYLDVGSHPEYASAECDSVRQLICQDKAGERILEDLREQAQDVLEDEGFDGSLYLFKNNVDSAGNSYGSHENYLIKRGLNMQRLTQALIPFLVTRTLLCGAGGWIQTAEGTRFVLSPRAEHLWEPASASTTRSRPMINTRDEPHADAEHYRRLHVISGDSSMAQGTTFLKVGTTALILRMLEAGVILPSLEISHPINALRQVSRDQDSLSPLALREGKTMTALEMQEVFFEAASSFCQKEGASTEEQEVLALWSELLEELRSGKYSRMYSCVDWAIKRRLIEQYALRDGLEPGHPRLKQLDLTYHDIARRRGLASILEESGRIEKFVRDEEIENAMTQAPSTTRASLRSTFISQARAAQLPYTVDWMNMRLNDFPQEHVLLKDPFETDTEKIKGLLELISHRPRKNQTSSQI